MPSHRIERLPAAPVEQAQETEAEAENQNKTNHEDFYGHTANFAGRAAEAFTNLADRMQQRQIDRAHTKALKEYKQRDPKDYIDHIRNVRDNEANIEASSFATNELSKEDRRADRQEALDNAARFAKGIGASAIAGVEGAATKVVTKTHEISHAHDVRSRARNINRLREADEQKQAEQKRAKEIREKELKRTQEALRRKQERKNRKHERSEKRKELASHTKDFFKNLGHKSLEKTANAGMITIGAGIVAGEKVADAVKAVAEGSVDLAHKAKEGVAATYANAKEGAANTIDSMKESYAAHQEKLQEAADKREHRNKVVKRAKHIAELRRDDVNKERRQERTEKREALLSRLKGGVAAVGASVMNTLGKAKQIGADFALKGKNFAGHARAAYEGAVEGWKSYEPAQEQQPEDDSQETEQAA